MTSKSRITAVDAITVALHEGLCVPTAKPHTVWSDAHLLADRRLAGKVVDRLHAAGWRIEPRDRSGTLMSADFLAVP